LQRPVIYPLGRTWGVDEPILMGTWVAVDEDKRGALGRGELKRVFEKMAAPVDDVVIEKLLSRPVHPQIT